MGVRAGGGITALQATGAFILLLPLPLLPLFLTTPTSVVVAALAATLLLHAIVLLA